ncbi:Kelch repeat and BTB domain-containing protein A55 [Bulinus truncatus]|nr:Kelch repeat and BTB domain-containing protein A55 [Bulinus truncatus]
MNVSGRIRQMRIYDQDDSQKLNEVKVQQDVSKKINPRFQQKVFECFSRGSNRQMFCDFTVMIDNVEFSCHKFVLNACSGFFETLFQFGNSKKTNIQGISIEIFSLILDAIYSGSDVLTQDNMMEMWNAGHQLQIGFLMSECEDFVLKNINSKNWYTVYCNAESLQSKNVLEFAYSFMVKNFFSVVNSENFIKLQYEDVIKILQNKQLPVCADFRMEAILK